MNKKDAINILIGNAVCIDPELHCDEDCPFYNGDEDCKYINKEFELKEAVKTLLETRNVLDNYIPNIKETNRYAKERWKK